MGDTKGYAYAYAYAAPRTKGYTEAYAKTTNLCYKSRIPASETR